MIQNSFGKKFGRMVGMLIILSILLNSSMAHAQEADATPAQEQTLYNPVEKQVIQLSDEGTKEGWSISAFETYSLKFLIRAKDALTWSLNIKDGGFHNPAIEKSYLKVLSIVNGFFIIGLLAIATMWMFSILIPRRYLKKVILIYGLAAVFINFALPLNQLFIDGTNLLQTTLLTEEGGNIQVTDIVQTPHYTEALSFKNENEKVIITEKRADKTTFKLDGFNEDSTVIGSLTTETEDIVSETKLSLKNQEISIVKDRQFNVHEEQLLFRGLLLIATGTAYFMIALIFVLRIVILWALLILSPILLLLAIFKSTRGWFYNWLSMYGRWLLIGPLTALGIAVIVNIWQLSGLPISMNDSYVPETFSSESVSNVVFYLPGKDKANTLSNSQEMMEYIIFLIMLYLPVVLAFALTRQKVFHESLSAVSKAIAQHSRTSEREFIRQVLATHDTEKEEEPRRPADLITSFKTLVSDRIGILAEKTMPLQKSANVSTSSAQKNHNANTGNLGATPVFRMLELIGQKDDNKASRQQIIEKLAHAEKITDKKEKEQISAVMHEIERRSNMKDKEAMTVIQEVITMRNMEAQQKEQNSPQTTEAEMTTSNVTNNINILESSAKKENQTPAPATSVIKENKTSASTKTKDNNKKTEQKNETEEREEREDDDKTPQADEKQNGPNPDHHAN